MPTEGSGEQDAVGRSTAVEETTVRPAVEADLPQLAELYLAARRAAVPAMPPIARSPDEVRAHVVGWDLTDPAGREVWIAEDDLGPSGMAVVKGSWLDALYVAPDRQGAGIGSLLLEVVRARRPDGFALWVFAANAPARGFYHHHGLIELEHTDGSGNEEGAPDVRMAWPGRDPLAYLRREVDVADAELAELLARRFALTAAIQGHKDRSGAGAGHAGRDAVREREIVARMARHAPGLAEERIAPIMDAVIAESLTSWEERRG